MPPRQIVRDKGAPAPVNPSKSSCLRSPHEVTKQPTKERNKTTVERVTDEDFIAAVEPIMRKHLQPVIGTGSGQTWFNYPELPTPEEVMSHGPMRPLENHPNATYATNEDYLEVQWRLLRHEGIEPLRRAVQGFRANPGMNETFETYIYDEVHCCGINVIRLGIFGRFVFSTPRSGQFIDWIKTERLTPGTCVALSPAHDNFDTLCFPAVVVGKDCRDATGMIPPIIDLEFEDTEMLAEVTNPNLDFVMIEARSNYYEAVRHVMLGLKQAAGETSPLTRYLTGDTNKVGFPAHITSSCRIDISTLSSIGERVSIAARGGLDKKLSSITGLDGSQLIALQRILATDLAIVRGPPGTGKTFTTMAALKVLLDTQTGQDPPIIVTAQKNDTIDDILSRLIKMSVKVARLGGQSKDDEIAQTSMSLLRNRVFKKTRSRLLRELDKKRDQLKMCTARCFPSEKPLLIRPSWLREEHLITESQHESMLKVSRSNPRALGNVSDPDGDSFTTWLHHEYCEPDPHPSLQQPHGEADGAHQNEGMRYRFLEEEDVSLLRKNRIVHRSVKLSRTAQVHHQWEMDSEAAGRMAEAELRVHADLWDIAPHKRSHVYEYLERKLVSATRIRIGELISEIKLLIGELKLERLIENFSTLKYLRARVIGCTTTGLTKYRALLMALKPRVMIVEEASETREANIAAALFPSLQQLVLVGDHLQLKPHADVQELGRPPFNLTISLFQRLVERGIEYSTLLVQRRMASAIRQVLNAWYPGLQDHSRVHQLPPVPGMGDARTIWLDHQEEESKAHTVSMCNEYEAALIAVFAHYLVLNGTDPSKITVLSFYSGQRMLIENTTSRLPGLANVKDPHSGAVLQKGLEIQTVDGYQGRENDIILLSVTRSSRDPRKPSVGFLDTLNRAIVALSRARLLNVVFGNMANLLSSATAEKIWAKVADGMKEVRSTFLPLVCVSHNRKFALHGSSMVRKAGSAIGCGEVCGTILPCGHACRIKCHPRYSPHPACRQCHEGSIQETPAGREGNESDPAPVYQVPFIRIRLRRSASGRNPATHLLCQQVKRVDDGGHEEDLLTFDEDTSKQSDLSGEQDLLTFDEEFSENSDLGEEDNLLIFEERSSDNSNLDLIDM